MESIQSTPYIKLRLRTPSRSITSLSYPTRLPALTIPSFYHLLGRPTLTHLFISDLLPHSSSVSVMRIVEIPIAKPNRDSGLRSFSVGLKPGKLLPDSSLKGYKRGNGRDWVVFKPISTASDDDYKKVKDFLDKSGYRHVGDLPWAQRWEAK